MRSPVWLAILLTVALGWPAPATSAPRPPGSPEPGPPGASAAFGPDPGPGGSGAPAAPGAAVAASVPFAPAAPAVRGWGWPLAGRPPVVRGFDPPATPYGRGHRGVDLGGAPGDPVVSAGAGTVTFAGLLAGRGVVTVTHAGGLRTTYEPLAVSVRRGTTVTRGTVLGRLLGAHPGCPRAACLHWGLLRGPTYLDPLTLVRRGPIRLLPLAPPPPTGMAPP